MALELTKPPRVDVAQIKTLREAGGIIAAQNDYLFRIYRLLAQTDTVAQSGTAQDLPEDFEPGDPVDPANTTLREVAEVANKALANAGTAATLAGNNDTRLDALAALAVLTLTVTNPPTQVEVQAIADKVDEIIGAV